MRLPKITKTSALTKGIILAIGTILVTVLVRPPPGRNQFPH